ncbi:MAG TPA: Holliday junction branch migration protein RuvA [Oligoflexia bacterium]|nr:Holliday junction branch migration protein RuvA [Oligoflexia bacterium]
MIGYLRGQILSKDGSDLVIDVQGVGYALSVPQRMSVKVNSTSEFFVHTHVRENAIDLFGFATGWERQVFLLLISVSGIGPRTALGLLSQLEPVQLLTALVREDRATLSSVSGIGKKTAERLIVEIADKGRKLLTERPGGVSNQTTVAAETLPSSAKPVRTKVPAQGASRNSDREIEITDIWNDALVALVNFGYREGDALAVIREASAEREAEGLEVQLEPLLKRCLQIVSKGRA